MASKTTPVSAHKVKPVANSLYNIVMGDHGDQVSSVRPLYTLPQNPRMYAVTEEMIVSFGVRAKTVKIVRSNNNNNNVIAFKVCTEGN